MSKGIEPGRVRANGLAAEEEARDEVERLDEPIEEEVLAEERRALFRTPGFPRMRTDWNRHDAVVLQRAKDLVQERILENFGDAYELMFDLYDVVRTRVTDESGEPVLDHWGLPQWERNSSGSYIEDWDALTSKERKRFLFTITTHIFDWEQRAAEAWGEAMFAKGQFEERFAGAFDERETGTVDARRAHANSESTDERYFAILVTIYSRRAEAIVRSLERLGQRLKDSLLT